MVPFAYVGTNQQYQIVVDLDGTVVNVLGKEYPLNANEYQIIQPDDFAVLTSNNPIQLIQMGHVCMTIALKVLLLMLQATPTFYTNTTTHYGGPFFLQIPSVDKWTNMSVLYQPTGLITNMNFPMMYLFRIYTTSNGIGRIQFDDYTIMADNYQSIPQSDYYYYENSTSMEPHRISVLDANVFYSVLSNFCVQQTKKPL